MKNIKENSLHAISPKDYKDYYFNYQKRKKSFNSIKEDELPKIKNNSKSLKQEYVIKNIKYDNTNLTTLQNTMINLNETSIDNTKTDLLNSTNKTQNLKTERICFPRISPTLTQIKNFKYKFKTKVPKKAGLLSIKYLDLIKLDSKSQILIYKITQNDKLFEKEIIDSIDDSPTKNKILDELKQIDKNTNSQIEYIMKNTSREAKEYSLKYLQTQPKIIYLSAEEIFKEIKNEVPLVLFDNVVDGKRKEKKNIIKKNKLSTLNDIFLDCAKVNIRKKIELRNQFNQEITIEYIEKLLKNEIRKIIILLSLYKSNANYENKDYNKEGINTSYLNDDSKNKINKNLLDKSFANFLRLNNYYKSLVNTNPKSRNQNIYNNDIHSQDIYNFNILNKSKLNNQRYNTESDYMNLFFNQISNNLDEDIHDIHNNTNFLINHFNSTKSFNNDKNVVRSPNDKSNFYFYNQNVNSQFENIVKHNNILDLKKRNNLIPLRIKGSIGDDSNSNKLHTINSEPDNNYLYNDINSSSNNTTNRNKDRKYIIKNMKHLKSEVEKNKINSIINKDINSANKHNNDNNNNNNRTDNSKIDNNNDILPSLKGNIFNKKNNQNNIQNEDKSDNIEKNNEIGKIKNNQKRNDKDDKKEENALKSKNEYYEENKDKLVNKSKNENENEKNNMNNNYKNNGSNIDNKNSDIYNLKEEHEKRHVHEKRKRKKKIEKNENENYNGKNDNQNGKEENEISEYEESEEFKEIEDNKENDKTIIKYQNKTKEISRNDKNENLHYISNKKSTKSINDYNEKRVKEKNKIKDNNSIKDSPNKRTIQTSKKVNSIKKSTKSIRKYEDSKSPKKKSKNKKNVKTKLLDKKTNKIKNLNLNKTNISNKKSILNGSNSESNSSSSSLDSKKPKTQIEIISKSINSIKNLANSKNTKSVIFSINTPLAFNPSFETIEKTTLKRSFSEDDLKSKRKNNSNEVNVIKLQDSDIDKIVDYVNEEEKRKMKSDKNAKKIEREKIETNPEENLHGLFKEKKENNGDNNGDLTRRDLIEKLKNNDYIIRQYLEGIIMAGLTKRDKNLNRQMKNNSILVYKNFNLGIFRFNKNFGKKDEIHTHEDFKPLTERTEDINESMNINNNKKKDEFKVSIGKINREKPKKSLIYDNMYLFPKKKNVNFILRKEVEEILNGGISSQLKKDEDELKSNRIKKLFEYNKKDFSKKKQKRNSKLFRKSIFLGDLIGKNDNSTKKIEPKEEIEKIEDKKEHNLDYKIKAFINKVKRMKMQGVTTGIGKLEMDDYINELMRNNLEKERENRIKAFLEHLEDYRFTEKKQREFRDTFLYKEPNLIQNLMVENYDEIMNNIKIRYNSEIKNDKMNLDKVSKNNYSSSTDKYLNNKNKKYAEHKNGKSYITSID